MSVREELNSTQGVEVAHYSTMNKVGFVLALLIGLGNVPSVAIPTPDGQAGPPMVVLVIDSLLGVGIIVAVLVGWLRRSKAAIRAATALMIISAITALPAFVTPDVPAGLVAGAGAMVLITIVTIVLMLKPARSPQV